MLSDQVRAALVSGRRSLSGSAAFLFECLFLEKVITTTSNARVLSASNDYMKFKAIWSFALSLAVVIFAALSRYILTETESRLQIMAFSSLAFCVEWIVKPSLGVTPRWSSALLTGLCSTAAIILVRWHLEGLCPHTWPQCPDPIYVVRKSWGI